MHFLKLYFVFKGPTYFDFDHILLYRNPLYVTYVLPRVTQIFVFSPDNVTLSPEPRKGAKNRPDEETERGEDEESAEDQPPPTGR